jgi:hypothetical protein
VQFVHASFLALADLQGQQHKIWAKWLKIIANFAALVKNCWGIDKLLHAISHCTINAIKKLLLLTKIL